MKIDKGGYGKMKGFVGWVLAGMLLAASGAGAEIAFGSGSDITSQHLDPGAYGVFSMSYFNMGTEPLDVSFEVEYPSDLRIEVDPPHLSMTASPTDAPDSSGSWLILDGGTRYVKTYPVNLYLKLPSTISRTKYTIKLIATAKGAQDSGGSGIAQSLVQIRETVFTIESAGRIDAGSSDIIRIDASSGDIIKDDAQKSFNNNQGSSSSSSGGGANIPSSSGNSPSTPSSSSGSQSSSNTKSGGFDISKDTSGNTNIELPTGKVSLDSGQTDAAIDLGLVTLLISIASLVVRIIK
jgi:hypothetical protein